MDRASNYETTAGSGTAKGVQGDGVVRHYKPGGGSPEKSGRGLSMTGASIPGAAGTRGQSPGIEGASLADSTGRAGSSSTAMLNKMWPLSKVDASQANGGTGFSFSGGSSSSSASASLDPHLGTGSSSAASVDNDAPLTETSTGNTDVAEHASKGELVSSNVSLFRRVHLKHLHWFQRRDRF